MLTIVHSYKWYNRLHYTGLSKPSCFYRKSGLFFLPEKEEMELPHHLKREYWSTSFIVEYVSTLITRYWTSALKEITSIIDYYETILPHLISLHEMCQLEHSYIRRLCGIIVSPNQENISSKEWMVHPLSGYNVYLIFETFKIMYSDNCSINSLLIHKNDGISELYCGHLPVWNETCPCKTINLLLTITFMDVETLFRISYVISNRKGLSIQIVDGSYKRQFMTYMRSITGYKYFFYRLMVHVAARSRLDLVSLRSHDSEYMLQLCVL